MKRVLAALALLPALALGATTTPIQLLSPVGSTPGQAILSTGPSTAPIWGGIALESVTGTLSVAKGGTGASSAPTALTNLGAAATAGSLAQFASTTSAQLAGVVSDETGAGALVFGSSPALTGVPTAPTATAGTNTTQLATTAFVNQAISAVGGGGRLLGVRLINSSQTYTPTAGTNSVIVVLVGGGGGGGGAGSTGAGQVSMGGGGAGGGVSVARFTSGFSGVSVTIGGPGSGNTAAAGGAGGNSAFGALMTANGGAGGSYTAPTSAPILGSGSAGGTAAGGLLWNFTGAPGMPSFALGNGSFQVIGGNGANGPYGNGGLAIPANSGTAANGTGYGSGGAGASATPGSGPYMGGNGTVGLCVIYEYS